MTTQTKIASAHENFADWLRESLESRGWKPVDLARGLRIQPSTITRWLAGSVPHAHTLERLQQYLDGQSVSMTARPQSPPGRMEAIRPLVQIDDVLYGFDHKDLIKLARLLSMPDTTKEVVLDRVFRALEREDSKDTPSS
jgi:transcriptional regulator with XRE-family HTH domain